MIEFKKTLCHLHPLNERKFYENITLGTVQTDLSCCRGSRIDKSEDSGCGDDDEDGGEDDDATEIKSSADTFHCDSDFSDYEIEEGDFQ